MLSIIIPTLNEEKYLPRLLKSVEKQTFSDYEIIVSDGGSKDQTVKLAQQYSCRVIINSDRKAPAVQRNNGAKVAKGDYIVFIDADTVLSNDFLFRSMNQIRKNKLDITGVYIKFNPNSFLYTILALFYNAITYLRQCYHPVSVGACIFVKKELHLRLSGFNEKMYFAEDSDYCQRGAKIGKFRIIKKRILYSSRRLERDGVFQTILKWVVLGGYSLFGGKIKKQIISYKMGGQNKKD